MRVFLMLLVLANLGFFAWQRWYVREVPSEPSPRAEVEGGRRLQLLGELKESEASVAEAEAEEAAAIEEPEPEVAQAPAEEVEIAPAVCATLGPFDSRDAAEVARDRLAELRRQPVLRETGGQIRSGFWVYLPPFDDRDAAKEVEGQLRTKGVRDLFIVTASEQRNAISLGLFSTPDRADQRAAEIGRLGFTPRVAERFRDATVFWVDFREQPGEPLEPESIGVMGAGETLPEKQEIPCGEIAEGGNEA